MKSSLNRSLTDQQQHEVDKVTPYVIKEAAKKLSENKSDPVYSFSSDCLINGTDQLFKQLSTVFKVFLIHGHFTLFLLLATLVPTAVYSRQHSINFHFTKILAITVFKRYLN